MLHQRLGLGQFGAGVDAEHFFRRQLDTGRDEVALAGDGDDVGEVEFALGVDVFEPVDEVEEVLGGDRQRMPPLQRAMAASSGVASLASTMRSTLRLGVEQQAAVAGPGSAGRIPATAIAEPDVAAGVE